MPKHHQVQGFKASDPVTRENSRTSKSTAVGFHVDCGHTRIALLTTPGPATPDEQIEEDEIRAQYPELQLDVFRYETDPTVAEQHELTPGDMTLHALACSEGHLIHPADPTFDDYDAIVLEWDGTQTHGTHLKDGSWDRMMLCIRRLMHDWNLPVVLAYTHGGRDRCSFEAPWTTADVLAYKHKQKTHRGLPWEGYFIHQLADDLECPVECLWESRLHWLKRRLLTKKKNGHRGAPTYRWVFAINPD